MDNWIEIAHVGECQPGKTLELVVEDRIVALFNVEGEFFALDGVCPHQGGPLGKGELSGCIVTCPWHGWQFDVRDGKNQLTSSLRHLAFPARVENDKILIQLV